MLFLLFIAVEIKVTLALWKPETLFSFLVSLWQNKLMWQESDAKTSTCRISGCRGALKISDIDGNQYCQSENEVGEFLGWSGIHSANPPGKKVYVESAALSSRLSGRLVGSC